MLGTFDTSADEVKGRLVQASRAISRFRRVPPQVCDSSMAPEAAERLLKRRVVSMAATFCATNNSDVDVDESRWACCGTTFSRLPDIQRHIVGQHTHCVDECARKVYECLRVQGPPFQGAQSVPTVPGGAQPVSLAQVKRCPLACVTKADGPCQSCGSAFEVAGYGLRPSQPVCPSADAGALQLNPRMELEATAIPILVGVDEIQNSPDAKDDGVVLLFYHYTTLTMPALVVQWLRDLCSGLDLVGKLRVSSEGLNGTLSGTEPSTTAFIAEVLRLSPLAEEMTPLDFKRSTGPVKAFSELKITLVSEIITIGIDPRVLPQTRAAERLSPQEFHEIVSRRENDVLILDVRNFFEHRIGRFDRAVTPDLRKFSYFPEYFAANADMFRSKKVLTYCTGGIRCERASACLLDLGVCTSVHQLHGGIHRYLEEFPNGFFRGKLFVFDDRLSISTNRDVLGTCFSCNAAHDDYKFCSTDGCRIMVLICDSCRLRGVTTCCSECGQCDDRQSQPACLCVRSRSRCPREHVEAQLT